MSFRLYRECDGARRLGNEINLITDAFPIRRLDVGIAMEREAYRGASGSGVPGALSRRNLLNTWFSRVKSFIGTSFCLSELDRSAKAQYAVPARSMTCSDAPKRRGTAHSAEKPPLRGSSPDADKAAAEARAGTLSVLNVPKCTQAKTRHPSASISGSLDAG
jgi:hypothetical protein